MRVAKTALLVVCLCASGLAVPLDPVPHKSACSTIFVKGASSDGSPSDVSALKAAKMTHSRAYLLWRYVEPELKTLNTSLSVESLRNDSATIDAWMASVDWSDHDRRLNPILEAGITPIAEVGEGTVYGLPKYQGGLADPKALGTDLYLAYIYLTSRGIVRRYKDRVRFWQIENELNEAYLAMLGGQRSLHVLGSHWSDWDFLTTLLQTLHMAVKDEQPTAVVTQNLHTDMSKASHDKAHLRGFYLDAVHDWKDLVDVFSFDGYPNYFGATPIQGDEIGRRTAAIRAAAPSKDVFVMETGYPIVNDTSVAPAVANFTEANQREYATQVWDSVLAAGGCGVMFFKFSPASGLPTPPGGFEKQDVSALDTLAKEVQSQSLLEMAAYVALHLKEASRFKYLVDYDQAWGFLRADGTPREAVAAIAKFQRP